MTVPDVVRLPLSFDVAGLVADVTNLPAAAWESHFNRAIFEGQWDGVALRSAGGATPLYPEPAASEFADTERLAGCPHLREALDQFHCRLNAVRLLVLGPGAVIKEHRDYRLAFEDGEVRLHVPILTNPDVEFFLDGHRIELQAGECWYLNVNRPHRVANRSTAPRVHLVLDCVVNDWLAGLIAR